MNIIFLAPFGIRPKGTLIARLLPLAGELQHLGHQVIIIAPPYTNPEDSGKEENTRGVRLLNIHLGSAMGALTSPILAWRMWRAARRESPDVIHLFKPKGYGGLAMMLHLMLARLGFHLPPVFVDTDDWEGKGGMETLHSYSRAERGLFRLQERWLPAHAAGVTVASRTLQTQVWGLGLPREKVLYLPNCVTDHPLGDGAGVRKKLGIPKTAPVVLLYTRFFEFSQEKLHQVFRMIHRGVPEAHFLVVGKGRNGEEQLLEKAAREDGYGPVLFQAGWIEPEDIPDYLAAGDVALYPFRDDLVNRSKCPAKATELLLAERAVVADYVGQLGEYIRPEVSGILCDPDDWEGMAERAIDLLKDAEKREALGRAGRRHLLEKFNWEKASADLMAFYRQGIQGQ